MKTRREQIEAMATSVTEQGGGPSDTCHNCKIFNWAGFVTGAEWADANPDESVSVEIVYDESVGLLEHKLAIAMAIFKQLDEWQGRQSCKASTYEISDDEFGRLQYLIHEGLEKIK